MSNSNKPSAGTGRTWTAFVMDAGLPVDMNGAHRAPSTYHDQRGALVVDGLKAKGILTARYSVACTDAASVRRYAQLVSKFRQGAADSSPMTAVPSDNSIRQEVDSNMSNIDEDSRAQSLAREQSPTQSPAEKPVRNASADQQSRREMAGKIRDLIERVEQTLAACKQHVAATTRPAADIPTDASGHRVNPNSGPAPGKNAGKVAPREPVQFSPRAREGQYALPPDVAASVLSVTDAEKRAAVARLMDTDMNIVGISSDGSPIEPRAHRAEPPVSEDDLGLSTAIKAIQDETSKYRIDAHRDWINRTASADSAEQESALFELEIPDTVEKWAINMIIQAAKQGIRPSVPETGLLVSYGGWPLVAEVYLIADGVRTLVSEAQAVAAAGGDRAAQRKAMRAQDSAYMNRENLERLSRMETAHWKMRTGRTLEGDDIYDALGIARPTEHGAHGDETRRELGLG
ncbi:hypothetical protein FX016_21750 [Cupriavidus gilardii]|nr:hypothetical protein FX016_21750 [Cupriavidus gilardii]